MAVILHQSTDVVRTPNLPTRDDGSEWHPAAKSMWREIWHSPMASQYTVVDIHSMLRLIDLEHCYWVADTVEDKRKLATELRLQSQLFGLSPLDRVRLKWEIEKAEAAESQGARRRGGSAPRPDPRITVPQSEDHVQNAEEVPDGEEA
jgi:hypothetical protein